jgi:probable HAF family extracellular repeat protein
MVGLGSLPVGGASSSFAYGASGDGSVVVGYSGAYAFRWTSAGGMVALPLNAAFGVSGDGSVVVGTSSPSGFDQATRWTSGGGPVHLGSLYSEKALSAAYAVNGDGSVVVGWGYYASGDQAFRWTSNGGMLGLGFPAGFLSTYAGAVSGDGSVVVGWGSTNSGYDQGFRWTSDEGMVGLGHLPNGYEGWAAGVSGDGSVVVGSDFVKYPDAGILEAFRWTSCTGMERLWDVLLANDVDPAARGWSVLSQANGISADGNTIVGFGARNGNGEAFIAIVPDPTALPLVALASMLPRRNRCRAAHRADRNSLKNYVDC